MISFFLVRMDIAGDLSATMHDAEENASHAVTDCWDDVINFESNSFDSGVVDGRSDAIESGEMLENGIQTGFLKGTSRFIVGRLIGEDFEYFVT